MSQTNPQGYGAVTTRRWGRKIAFWLGGVALTCVILVALAGICFVAMPVSLLSRNLTLAPVVVAVYGTLLEGRADLSGGYQMSWRSGLQPSGLGSAIVLEGADTRIIGKATAGLRGVAVSQVMGRAGPGLAQLVPGAWNCDMSAKIDDVHFRWGWRRADAGGVVTTPAGECSKGARVIDMPPLLLSLAQDGKDALANLAVVEGRALAQVRIARDRMLGITIEPAAADIFPALPRGGAIRLQLPF